jgi:hypothetical protein
MKLTDGHCKINGLHVTEVEIKNLRILEVAQGVQAPPAMTATYATLEGQPGSVAQGTKASVTATHGKCTAYPENWSERTHDLLNQLLDSMEHDLLPRHFSEGGSVEGEHARLEPGEDEAAEQI